VTRTDPIRIVVAEDQALVLGAIAALLDLEPDMAVVGRASDGVAAVERVCALAPDILLTDIEMPGVTGIDTAGMLLEERSSTRTVIVTTFAHPGYLTRARAAGVRGYLLKDSPVEQLAAAIHEVARGDVVIPAELAAAAWDAGADPLTQRERDAVGGRKACQTR
jgi:two-component system response regulator DesR